MTDIGCGCTLNADAYEDTKVYREEVRLARKGHACCECGDMIHPGDRYEHASGLSDYWWRFKTCMTCRAIRRDHCCSWVFGNLREAIWDALGVDYISGRIDPRWNSDDTLPGERVEEP